MAIIRTKEQCRALVEEFEKGTQSKTYFVNELGINHVTFNAKIKLYQNEQGITNLKTKEETNMHPAFVEIMKPIIEEPRAKSIPFTLKQVSMEFNEETDVSSDCRQSGGTKYPHFLVVDNFC